MPRWTAPGPVDSERPSPLVELVVGELHVAALDRVEDVLRPRHEQPHDRALLLAHGAEDPLRLHALEEHGLAAHEEAAEPVHLRAGVVERRDAEEHVVLRLPVVVLLHLAGVHEAVVLEHDRLREAGRAAREVDRRVVVIGERDRRGAARAVRHEAPVGLGEGGTVVAHVEARAHARDAVRDLLHAAHELGAEHERVGVGKLQAVLDFIRRVAEVERHGETPGAQHAEVDGQPLEAVHQEDCDLVALLVAAREEEVGEAVRLLLELGPRDFAAEALHGAGLDERVFPPRGVAVLKLLRVDFDERRVVRPLFRVAREDFCDLHGGKYTKSARVRHGT